MSSTVNVTAALVVRWSGFTDTFNMIKIKMACRIIIYHTVDKYDNVSIILLLAE